MRLDWAGLPVAVTDEEITTLRGDCITARNTALAMLCADALGGDEAARGRVAKIIADAAAARAQTEEPS